MSHGTYSPCRLCGSPAHVPPPVDAGTHKHHQVACNECGIEVTALSAADALSVWTRLMYAEASSAVSTLTVDESMRIDSALAAAAASAEIPQIAPGRGESAVSPLPIAETPNPVRSSDGVFTD